MLSHVVSSTEEGADLEACMNVHPYEILPRTLCRPNAQIIQRFIVFYIAVFKE